MGRNQRPVVRTVHIEECWLVGELLAPAPGSRWLDLGTGGGLPGLVLAVQFPDVRWTLVDSVAKKLRAVKQFATELELRNVTTTLGRAEDLAWEHGYRGRYDGVVSRAVAPMPTLLELARGFLANGGRVAAIKGPKAADELAAASAALSELSFSLVHRQRVGDTLRRTVLVTIRADGPPPHGYPRRAGLPSSQPLGVLPTRVGPT